MSSNPVLNVELVHGLLTLSHPRYNYSDQYSTAEERAIFGPTGMIMPALERLIQMENDSGIQFLIEIVMQQALAVAEAWVEYRIATGYTTDMPNYRWYILSLLEARDNFIGGFYGTVNSTGMPCKLHKAVVDLPFVDLWNALWKQQRAFNCDGLKENISKMYLWVLESFLSQTWISEPLLKRITYTVIRNWNNVYEGAPITPSVVNPLVLTANIDFGFIETADMRDYRSYMCLHWSQYLYPEETRNLDSWLEDLDRYDIVEDEDDGDEDWGSDEEWFSDEEWNSDEEEEEDLEELLDTNDQSHLEAYGPMIDPREHAHCVTAVPKDQNCTICVQEFYDGAEAEVGVGQQCLRMRTCGHHFHEACIQTWINGIAVNSNLCPDCRGTMFEERRAVRAVCRGGGDLWYWIERVQTPSGTVIVFHQV